MAVRKYNPKRIVGSWKGSVGGRDFAVRFTGYMDGTFVAADYDEDHVTKHIGAQGEVSLVLNANESGTVTVTIVQGSETNDELSVLIPNASLNRLPLGVLEFVDLNGTTQIESNEACIKKTASVEFGKDIAARQWVFECADLKLFVGGAGDF